jgi:hypothetical protein
METQNVLSACGKNHEAATTDAVKDSLIETQAQRLVELESLFVCKHEEGYVIDERSGCPSSLATQKHVHSLSLEVHRLCAVNAELLQDNMDQLQQNEEMLKDLQRSTSEIEGPNQEAANLSELIDFFKRANHDLCEQHTELAEEQDRSADNYNYFLA